MLQTIFHGLIRCIVPVVILVVPYPTLSQHDVPLCSSNNPDVDGDGWGWENNRTCIVSGSAADHGGVPSVGSQTHPACVSADSDPDGDGYGFENGVSCLVKHSSNVDSFNGFPLCSTDSDPDGDGYGFENGVSCLMSQPPKLDTFDGFPLCSAESDPDGDGYGFENGVSCVVQASSDRPADTGIPVCTLASDPDADGYGWENGRSCVVTDVRTGKEVSGQFELSDITDVVLVTGQSNLLASHTKYDSYKDKPHQRVFAYTDKGWAVADLHQVWDIHAHPGNHSLTNPANQPYNNFALHFGKQLAGADSGRVVAFIVASAPGKGIAHWDRNSGFYRFIGDKVSSALKEIPHKYSVDGVLWQQGENDWLYEGTSDAGATGFASRESYEYKNYYKIKLENLIRNIRGESWGRADTAFICGETRRAEGVNRRLMALNSDNDMLTACVPATDLPKRADDSYGSHFSAEGLRELGRRYAYQYLSMTAR